MNTHSKLTQDTRDKSPCSNGMSEKQVEQKLVRAVKAAGGICPKWVSPGLDGVPDRIVLLPGGHIAFVELKAPGKKLRPLQSARIEQLQRLGFDALVLDDVNDIEPLLHGMIGDVPATGCICDACDVGKARQCPHAQGVHYDPWGEGIQAPEWCPQRSDELPF